MDVSEADLHINPKVYEWTGRTISLLERVLKVNIKFHHAHDQIEAGDIFLFNHFARFETFIPQYLIYRETGNLSRSVAAAEFFRGDDAFTRYLLSLGAVPTDYPGLLPFLAAEVLRGHKIILFPEGGMVKDRRVVDRKGRYSVYSRTAHERRKHHTGAAVVAQAVEAFRATVLRAAEDGQSDRLARWADQLGLEGTEALLAASRRPTLVVPANITFYPLRIRGNWLQKGAEIFSRGLHPRLAEELLIEGNILLRDTDMDIRLGDPVRPQDFWSGLDRWLVRRVGSKVGSLGGFLASVTETSRWDERLWNRRARRNALHIRDAYMVAMYQGLSVNLSHLASWLVFRFLDKAETEVPRERFRQALYLCVKRVQEAQGIHLHRSLRNPEAYAGLLRGQCPGLDQLMAMAESSELLEACEETYRFLPHLREKHGFDDIRLGNPLEVYANELAPLSAATRAVDRALRTAVRLLDRELAMLRFDDEERAFAWDRAAFHKPRHQEINGQQTATKSGEPFLLLPKAARDLAVLLVHGFTASPAEMRALGDRVLQAGYPALGVRLKGHGTSPWDLLERRWEDWLDSVRTGYEILRGLSERICVVGFSAGAALSLRWAAEQPHGLAGVVAAAPPMKVRDRSMRLVPLMHGANRLARSTSLVQGVMLFHRSHPEHPEVNYLHMPIRALYELGLLIDDFEAHLGEVSCPVLLLQATDDPTVDPASAHLVLDRLGTPHKELMEISADRHGILYEDTGGAHDRVMAFIGSLDQAGRPDSR